MVDADISDRSHAALVRDTRKRSVLISAGGAVLAVVLIVGGRAIIQARASSQAAPSAEPPITVSVLRVAERSSYEQLSHHVGLVEPAKNTDLAFERGGTVVAVLVEEGERIRRGAAIARLDTRSLRAEREGQQASRAALESDLERAQLAFERQRSLEGRNFAAGQSLDDARLAVVRSEALIQQLDAAISAIDVLLDKSELRAPYDAQVGRRWVDEGATVAAGAPVASLLDRIAPRARIGVPVAVARTLSETTTQNVTVDGIKYPATLVSKRQDVSMQTRTIDALFELDVTDLPVPVFGETAELSISQTVATDGYRVPVSALSEGEAGLWSLLLAIPDEPDGSAGRVMRESVEIVHTDGVVAYVKGNLSVDAGIIRTGPHRIVPGQRVQSVIQE